jgi:hypothetical protein
MTPRSPLFVPQGFDRVEARRAAGWKIAEHDTEQRGEGEGLNDDLRVDGERNLQHPGCHESEAETEQDADKRSTHKIHLGGGHNDY